MGIFTNPEEINSIGSSLDSLRTSFDNSIKTITTKIKELEVQDTAGVRDAIDDAVSLLSTTQTNTDTFFEELIEVDVCDNAGSIEEAVEKARQAAEQH